MLRKILFWMVDLFGDIWSVWNIKFMFTKVRQWVNHRFWIKTPKYFRWLTTPQASITSYRKKKISLGIHVKGKWRMKCCYQSRLAAKLILLPWDKSTFHRHKCEITQTFIFKYSFYWYVKWEDSWKFSFLLIHAISSKCSMR